MSEFGGKKFTGMAMRFTLAAKDDKPESTFVLVTPDETTLRRIAMDHMGCTRYKSSMAKMVRVEELR